MNAKKVNKIIQDFRKAFSEHTGKPIEHQIIIVGSEVAKYLKENSEFDNISDHIIEAQ